MMRDQSSSPEQQQVAAGTTGKRRALGEQDKQRMSKEVCDTILGHANERFSFTSHLPLPFSEPVRATSSPHDLLTKEIAGCLLAAAAAGRTAERAITAPTPRGGTAVINGNEVVPLVIGELRGPPKARVSFTLDVVAGSISLHK
ncbi:unnamed protein product [Arctogadus glacialis]